MKIFLHDLIWILPASLGLGLVFAFLSHGFWWIGWLAYAAILFLGIKAIAALWRSAGAGRSLGLILVLTVVLRLGLGIAFSYVLPAYGDDNAAENAGYIFQDAYTRDNQAWELANSSGSLWKAFDKSYSSDQYGGLLFTSSLFYRFLSPDAHRPWLIISLAALISAIGVGLSYKAVRSVWGEKMALIVGWLMVAFPESVLLGSSQMREPFLITFIAMLFWGVVNWGQNRRTSAAWAAGGVFGMLVFSPGVALVGIIVIAIWFWLHDKEHRFNQLWWLAGVAAVVLLTALLLADAIGSSLNVQGGPLANILNWFRYSMQWDIYLMERNSGWIQNVFHSLPASFQMPFIIGYGVAQPVLPAAVADPAVWPMRVLGILRGIGWYAFAPFLAYSLRPILKIDKKSERAAWFWLWAISWIWIIVSAARGGGDQWDNPRYRVILIFFQAVLVGLALVWQRTAHDPWLGRILAVEGVFLICFGYWYAARYTHWAAGQAHVFVIIGVVVILSSLILIGGWIMDRRRARRT
jgi:hypothetical protein